MPGMGELLIILVIVLLIFGAGKLPAIGDALGRSIKNFKRSALNEGNIDVSKKDGGQSELSSRDGVDEAEVVSSPKGSEKEPAVRGADDR